ncbi:hypothetical protein [Pseudomonas syringae]|uniref:hypothetical protein n=1 Tax=Pseudomonas syringae TaxID=317 RepID=UPI000648CBCE|nr:hypothetical protein [Pseudomonas syringae]
MPKFDLDLNRVTFEHYITGKAAINFPWINTTSGGWHYLSYWDSAVGQAKVSLAGIHYPDTSKYFGEEGILIATEELKLRGWDIDHQVFMADHFRAAGDMVLKWVLGGSEHCNVELLDWFPDDQDLADVAMLLRRACDKLDRTERDHLNRWLELQLR